MMGIESLRAGNAAFAADPTASSPRPQQPAGRHPYLCLCCLAVKNGRQEHIAGKVTSFLGFEFIWVPHPFHLSFCAAHGGWVRVGVGR